MGTKYVNVDRQTPMLLPPDVREWVADNELAHFVLEAVEATDLAFGAGQRAWQRRCAISAGADAGPAHLQLRHGHV